MRAFIAIPMPETVTTALAPVLDAIPLGRAVAPENLHLTLAFLGDVRETMLEEIHFALETLRHPAFDITLAGLDTFGGSRPASLHIGVQQPCTGLAELQGRVRSRLHGAGVELERRRFLPHVTLARFGRTMTPDETGRIGRFLAARADLRLPPFRAACFCLYESILTADGAHYDALSTYPLVASA